MASWRSVVERSVEHPLPCFISQLQRAARISKYHLPSGFPAWSATTFLPCFTSAHAQIAHRMDFLFSAFFRVFAVCVVVVVVVVVAVAVDVDGVVVIVVVVVLFVVVVVLVIAVVALIVFVSF